jgi:hypothetical protein
VSEEYLEAIHNAIATWAAALEECLDGLITLTDVTGTQPSEQQAADIGLHSRRGPRWRGGLFRHGGLRGRRLPERPDQLGGAAQLGPEAVFP